MKKYLFLFAAGTVLFGCSTDLDVNAPYKDITIVYGLLNQRDSIHFIKINKAFLGEGNAFEYAQIQDSNEYHDEAITHMMVHRLNSAGQRVDSYVLRDTLITNREPGVFHSPEQRLFYFTHPASLIAQNTITVYLDQNSEYELDLVVKGNAVGARTTVVNDFSINSVNVSPNQLVGFYGNLGYIPYVFRWSSGRNGKRYELSWRFNYTEVIGGEHIERSITQRMATRVATNSATGGESLEVSYPGEQFFNTLANSISQNPAVEYRIFRGLDFVMAVANDEFHTALSLSEPISGIVEERPAYSNVENGYGIFGSRYTKSVIGKRLSGATLDHLLNSALMAPFNFCWENDIGVLVCD